MDEPEMHDAKWKKATFEKAAFCMFPFYSILEKARL